MSYFQITSLREGSRQGYCVGNAQSDLLPLRAPSESSQLERNCSEVTEPIWIYMDTFTNEKNCELEMFHVPS